MLAHAFRPRHRSERRQLSPRQFHLAGGRGPIISETARRAVVIIRRCHRRFIARNARVAGDTMPISIYMPPSLFPAPLGTTTPIRISPIDENFRGISRIDRKFELTLSRRSYPPKLAAFGGE